MKKISLIATDLDGTLLNTEKEITPAVYDALAEASERGVLFVPATGRAFSVVPEEIRELPFVRFIITINGAYIVDTKDGSVVSSAEMDYELAISMMEFLDTLPVIYECCYENSSKMSKAHHDKIREFSLDEETYKMLLHQRFPVGDLKAAVRERAKPVQKLQFYFTDSTEKQKYISLIDGRFPGLAVSSSMINNVEITNAKANKGDAVISLCDVLGIDREEIMTFGDGFNDISMIEAAAVGVAMGNAEPEVKAAADIIAPSCDEDGVAVIVRDYILK